MRPCAIEPGGGFSDSVDQRFVPCDHLSGRPRATEPVDGNLALGSGATVHSNMHSCRISLPTCHTALCDHLSVRPCATEHVDGVSALDLDGALDQRTMLPKAGDHADGDGSHCRLHGARNARL